MGISLIISHPIASPDLQVSLHKPLFVLTQNQYPLQYNQQHMLPTLLNQACFYLFQPDYAVFTLSHETNHSQEICACVDNYFL